MINDLSAAFAAAPLTQGSLFYGTYSMLGLVFRKSAIMLAHPLAFGL